MIFCAQFLTFWSLTQQKLTEEKYEVQSCIPEAAILVCTATEPKLTLKVTLTSPKMRDDAETDEQGLCLCVSELGHNFEKFFILAWETFLMEDCSSVVVNPLSE